MGNGPDDRRETQGRRPIIAVENSPVTVFIEFEIGIDASA